MPESKPPVENEDFVAEIAQASKEAPEERSSDHDLIEKVRENLKQSEDDVESERSAYRMANFYTIKSIANAVKRRLAENKDIAIAVTGFEHDGKSTLAIDLGSLISPKFSFERNMIWSPTYKEIREKVVSLPKGDIVISDEAIKAMYKLEWQQKLSVYLNKFYALCAQEHKASLFCMPYFSDFNPYFRKQRIRIWIHVIGSISKEREVGWAIMFQRTWSMFADDPWYFYENQKLIEKYSKQNRIRENEMGLEDKIAALSRSRNMVGVFPFRRMPDEAFAEYSRMKATYAYSDIGEAGRKKILEEGEDFGGMGKCDNCRAHQWQFLKRKQAIRCQACGNEKPWKPVTVV